MESKTIPAAARRSLTQSQFEKVLMEMRPRAVREVVKATVLIEGRLDGQPMLAAFDFMAQVGYLQVRTVADDGRPVPSGDAGMPSP